MLIVKVFLKFRETIISVNLIAGRLLSCRAYFLFKLTTKS